VRGIFTGAITNWKDLGGEDESISVLTRDPFSESYALFRETVLGNQEVTLRSLPAGGNLAVIGAVARNRSAIGFGSLADPKRLHGVKAVAIQADDGTTPILPVAAAIEQGTYPLTRTMYLYLRNRPAGATKALVDWILSPDGQVHVASTDCFRER
jgi:phosphate transport system substrate-binding protein